MAELQDGNPLAVEIMAERASAYFTTARKMEAALKELAEFDRAFLTTKTNAEQQRRRQELFAEAAEQVWVFIIQREAMKLPHYEELYSDYGIPEEVRNRMGPKICLWKG